MKKNLLLLFIGILHVAFVTAQVQTTSTVEEYTVSSDSTVILGPGIQSFAMDIRVNGVFIHQTFYSNTIPSVFVQKGRDLYIDNIICTDDNGKKKKLPNRKYIVK